jgi:hypothetical protein
MLIIIYGYTTDKLAWPMLYILLSGDARQEKRMTKREKTFFTLMVLQALKAGIISKEQAVEEIQNLSNC